MKYFISDTFTVSLLILKIYMYDPHRMHHQHTIYDIFYINFPRLCELKYPQWRNKVFRLNRVLGVADRWIPVLFTSNPYRALL